ncbi:MAG TPA: chorismate-binding protein, partial [Niabella sp.]|nr:chorismate-binding protein [Niabella sp.]
DLYINLRCMQVGKDKIAIYTGGGITAASDAEEEWQETILKSKTVAEKINPSKTMKLNETIR